MEETPSFDSAVQQLQQFLAEQGWPTRIVWRTEADIVHLPGRDVVVRQRVEREAASGARVHYDEGFRQGVGIALQVPCEVDGAACTTVYWTTDVVEAGYRMLPDDGLKLSVATKLPTGSCVGPLGWWLASQRRRRWDAAFRSASGRDAQQGVAADGVPPRPLNVRSLGRPGNNSTATVSDNDARSAFALTKMRLTWTRVRSLVLLVILSCVSVKASATEPFYPPVTKEALVGEWAGYWRGKPLGDILLISMEIDRNLRGTLARTSADGYSLIYEIDQVVVESGKVTVRGHDRSRSNVQVLMEASGGVLGVDGWLDAVVTDKRNDHLVFQVRLEKAPDHLLAKLGRMLRAVRTARRAVGK